MRRRYLATLGRALVAGLGATALMALPTTHQADAAVTPSC